MRTEVELPLGVLSSERKSLQRVIYNGLTYSGPSEGKRGRFPETGNVYDKGGGPCEKGKGREVGGVVTEDEVGV